MKGSNGPAIKRSDILNEAKLCFRIIAKMGNLKRQAYSWQKRKQGGVHYLKKRPIFYKSNPYGRKVFAYELQEQSICSRG